MKKGMLCGIVLLLLVMIFADVMAVENQQKQLPERGILLAPEYSGIMLSKDENTTVDVTVINKGKRDEFLNLEVLEVPNGWKAYFKTFSYGINGVFLKGDSSKNITLRIEPSKGARPGNYTLKLKASTKDNALTSTSELVVNIGQKTGEKEGETVKLITSYPVLRGPSDAKFEFNIDVENKLDKEILYSLSAEAPENWEVNFKPGWEEKYISSIRLKEDQQRSVTVVVKPSPTAVPDEYPIKVNVSSEYGKASTTLTVVITGVHKLDMGTTNDLLSLTTTRGTRTSMSFFIKNSGTAPLSNIQFLSLKPENWKVEFTPEKVELLNPNEIKQIEAVITPSEAAIVGDYSVNITAEGGKVSKNLELRVTVKAKPVWGWVGIFIILIVVAGLVFVFYRFGRR